MNPSGPHFVTTVVDSIIEHSDEWHIRLVGGDPVIHVHKSGIGVWCYYDEVRFYEPEYAKAIEISKEEKALLGNAIRNDRKGKEKALRLAAVKRCMAQFNKKETEVSISWAATIIAIFIALCVVFAVVFI